MPASWDGRRARTRKNLNGGSPPRRIASGSNACARAPSKDGNNPATQAAVLVHDKLLKNLDAELAKRGPWLVGEMFTLADIGITPYVHRLLELGLQGMWAARPRVAEWLDRVTARPSFEEAIVKYPARYAEDEDEEEDARDWAEVKKILDSA